MLHLSFDGWKCFFRVSLPSREDLQKLPQYELTSPLSYEPQRRYDSRRVRGPEDTSAVTVEEWRARLGFPSYPVTEQTLKNTTHMVTSLQAKTRRDHYKTRVWALRPKRINDTMYSDTFFSHIPSCRGYKMFQLFAFKRSKLTVIKLMKRERQAPECYEDVIRDIGAPNRTVTDNATVLTGVRWTTINRKYCIETGLSVPYHQHQNFAEGEGGNFKFALLKLFHYTPHAPISYWCYAAEFLDLVRRHLSKISLRGRSGHEMIFGETSDISIFRFRWFQPVWYYCPTVSFPTDKMRPGFFLGIAQGTGDGFSYIILPVDKLSDISETRNPPTVVRSVVRSRSLSELETDAPRCVDTRSGFRFENRLGDELFGSEELTPHRSVDTAADDDLLPLVFPTSLSLLTTTCQHAHARLILLSWTLLLVQRRWMRT